jgi:hypothetical protein
VIVDDVIPRRALLRVGGTAVAGGLAGCLGHADPLEESHRTVRFWLAEASPSESTREAVDPIVYGSLPTDEQEIVRTALDEGEYTEPMGEESAALDSLRDRIEARTDTEATDELEVYLRRDDAYYRVGFAAGDNIIAHPDM